MSTIPKTRTRSRKPTESTSPVPAPTQPALPPSASFQAGYSQGAHAAAHEKRHQQAPHTADALYAFIQTRLDPLQQARQWDAAKNPIPLGWHAGFVSGYLSTLFTAGTTSALDGGQPA